MSVWYTSDELNFIDWLGTGTFCAPGQHDPKPRYQDRLSMLRGYRAGIRLRSDWGSLDQKKIELHVDNLIRSIEQSTKQ